MSRLSDYNKKRDFRASPEPEGKIEQSNQFRFCIQKHDARRLHYDFRIELDGVLLSWAVPKGPSSDPSVRRLAIQTEDHPVSYLHFEGTIPKGNYGAGSVILWDIGTYRLPEDKNSRNLAAAVRDQYEQGKIHLFFDGQKIKGEYTLIRTGKDNQWLLIKVKDSFADGKEFSEESVLSGRLVSEVEEKDNALGKIMKQGAPSDFPSEFKPMLATLSNEPFSNSSWLYEVKYDGYRCLVFIENEKIRMLSRNGQLLNDRFEELVEAARELPSNCVLDGEIIVPDRTGGGDFSRLQARYQDNQIHPLRLVLFDLLYLEGRDFSGLALSLRKDALKLILESVSNRRIAYSAHVEGRGKEYWQASQKLGLEGVIAKRKDSIYHKNTRSDLWLKFKSMKADDFVIAGLTPSTSRAFGAILLARPIGNGEFEFAGKVGTGFSEKEMDSLLKTLKERKTSSGIVDPGEAVLFYTEPYYMAEVKFKEKTKQGKLRHPSFVRLRTDKHFEIEDNSAHQDSNSSPETLIPEGVNLTNSDKIFFPKENITKGDVIEYYARMVDWILPHLAHRPLTLKRTPNGIQDKGFYQKDVRDDLPDFVDTKEISSKSSDKDFITYALCNNASSLVFLANYGCVEMHCWNSREDKLDHPDHMVFDIDPPGSKFEMAREGAMTLIEILEKLEVTYGIKTSGGDGIHVYLPIELKYSHKQARDMTHVIAKIWLKKMGQKGSLERSPSKRKNQVYLDYLQNARGKTMACPYSLRVRSGVPVSMPVTLEELQNLKSPADMNIRVVPDLVRNRKDPWKGLYDHRMKLEEIVEKVSD